MSPFRAARSSSFTAMRRSSGVEPSAFAFLRAVRSAERWARLRTVAARDFRMFFFAEAMFGTDDLQNGSSSRSSRAREARPAAETCQGAVRLRLVRAPARL